MFLPDLNQDGFIDLAVGSACKDALLMGGMECARKQGERRVRDDNETRPEKRVGIEWDKLALVQGIKSDAEKMGWERMQVETGYLEAREGRRETTMEMKQKGGKG
jgi:hypothetical protein